MALKRLAIKGYGQLELNNAAFRRDGRIEAQCALDSSDFSEMPAENGMLLAVDSVASKIKIADGSLPVVINYSAEHMYESAKSGLKNFKLEWEDGFLPRCGYLSKGDKFTTNTIAYDTDLYANDSAMWSAVESVATSAIYGGICSNGAIALLSAEPTQGPVLKVIEASTMPDGQPAIHFVCIAE